MGRHFIIWGEGLSWGMNRISEVLCFAKLLSVCFKGAPGGAVVKKKSSCQGRTCRFYPWVRKMASSRKWEATPVFLPGKFHGQRRLAGCSPWDRKESDTTELACR